MKSNKILFALVGLFIILLGFGAALLFLYKTNSKKITGPDTTIPVLYNLYREKELSGTWDEKTLIIENLKIFAGEKTPEQVYGIKKIRARELTPLQRRAQHYLQYGDDEAAKKEIQRLIDKVFPDLNKILKKSSSANSSTPPSLSLQNILVPPASAQERRCIDSDCYLEYNIPSQGFENKLLIHTLVNAEDNFRSAVSEAVSDSLRTYRGLGLRTRKTYVLVIPMSNPAALGADASAVNANVLGEEVCRVQVWYAGIQSFIENPAVFKQILAHEVFHCVEDDNYMMQNRGPSVAATEWWAEGGAEYFSNVVYPSTNEEDYYNSDFDSESPTTPIHRMSYEANVFLQYLANETGNAGVLSLFASLPTSGSFDEQEAALSAYSNMNDLFHRFGEHYLDNQIHDTGGGNRPLNPTFSDVDRVTDTHTYRYSSQPFVITRKKMVFDPDNKQFHIQTRDENPGKYSAEKEGETTWGNLPETIGNFSCDGDSESSTYKVLLTNTRSGHTEYQLTVDVRAENAGGGTESAPAGVDASSRDNCLIGRWHIDPASDRSALQALFSGHQATQRTQITNFSINADLCMKRNGIANGTLDYSVGTNTPMDRGMNMIMNINMQMNAQGNYAAGGSTLNIWNFAVNSSGQATISIAGRTRSTNLPTPPSTHPAQLHYTCRGDNLEIQIPMEPFPMVHLSKVRSH